MTVLSRGYGAESGPNDEALLLEENLPDVPHLRARTASRWRGPPSKSWKVSCWCWTTAFSTAGCSATSTWC